MQTLYLSLAALFVLSASVCADWASARGRRVSLLPKGKSCTKRSTGGHDTRGNKDRAHATTQPCALGLEGLLMWSNITPMIRLQNSFLSNTNATSKSHRADEVQLCASLCLEDMHECTVSKGALFYGKTRRRHAVEFDEELRKITLDAINDCRHIIESGQTPKPLTAPVNAAIARSKISVTQRFLIKMPRWLNKKIVTSLKKGS